MAYDLHPEYLSTKWALELDLPKRSGYNTTTPTSSRSPASTASHEPVVGIAFDGTGYGTDGHIWGGEVLIGDWAGFERFAHLRRGAARRAARRRSRRPARMASVATLDAIRAPRPRRSRAAPRAPRRRRGSAPAADDRTRSELARQPRRWVGCSTRSPPSSACATTPATRARRRSSSRRRRTSRRKAAYEFELHSGGSDGRGGPALVIDPAPGTSRRLSSDLRAGVSPADRRRCDSTRASARV